ncbi:MAG: hypothetical protein ACRYGM_26320 [Janthinobacterium lividum]
MSSPSRPPAHAIPADPSGDDAYYRAVLHDLIDRGADLARRLHERAAGPANADGDPTIAFDRVARAIRRTIALARHIAANPVAARPEQSHADSRADSRADTRARLIRGVEDAIHSQRRGGDAEPLYAELGERLEDPALEFDLAHRPVAEIIEEIARDLGVAVQGRSYVWRRRTPQDIATLRRRALAAPHEAAAQAPQAIPPNPPPPSG